MFSGYVYKQYKMIKNVINYTKETLTMSNKQTHKYNINN